MRLSRKTIGRGFWAYLFFFIALEPAAFQHYNLTDKLFTAAQLLMLAAVVYFQSRHFFRRRNGVSRVALALIAYYVYLTLITFINHGRTWNVFLQMVQFIGFLLYLDIVLKENPRAVFGAALNILTLYIIINFALVMVRPGGLYKTNYFSNNYLLGYDNQNINFMLPALVLVILKNQYVKRCTLHVLLLYSLAWGTAIRIWSGMTLVAVGLMTLVAIILYRGEKSFVTKKIFTGKLFNLINYIFAALAANVMLVFLRLQYYLEFLIVGVLQKDLTLTSRTYIWDRNLAFIRQRWLFGYGRENYAERAIKFGRSANNPIGLHAHNRMIETLYSGGVVLFTLYLGILFYAGAKLRKVGNTAFAKVLSLGIFVYMIGMLSEYYDYCLWFWGLLVIAENAFEVLKRLKGRDEAAVLRAYRARGNGRGRATT